MPGVAVIVPTLGRAPEWREVLRRLEQEGPDAERILVSPPTLTLDPSAARWRRIPVEASAGFARAVNVALAESAAARVALVNDDALPEPGWLATLEAALESDPGLAAVQGVNLQALRSELCDGCGLAWNRVWQAVQIGRGGPPPARDAAPFAVFGVSATAALYRRAALDAVALGPGRLFDDRLESWYEDVELAVRLRAEGWTARCVPAARTLHRGSTTGATMPLRRSYLLARNRWWVAARLLGRRLPREIGPLLLGDLREAARAAREGRWGGACIGLLAPLLALPGLGRFAHRGEALGAEPRAGVSL